MSALAAALAGEILLVSGRPSAGLALLVLGGVLFALLRPLPGEGVSSGPETRRQTLIALAVVTALAMATRLFRITEIPPGLWDDETAIAHFALDGLAGKGQPPWRVIPHLEVAWGYVWLQALVLKLVPGALGVRLPGAIAGALVAPALYLLGRRFLSRGASLLIAALWAVAFWPLNMGRWGHVNSFTPLFFCLAMGWVWDGLSTGRRKPWILAGAVFGISLYVYSANRALAFLVVAFVTYWALIFDRSSRRRAAAGLFLFLLGALPFAAPIAAVYLSNPAMYLERTRSVSIFDPRYTPDPWRGILENAGTYARTFHLRGDPNPRHDLQQRPMLDVVLAALWTLGLGAVLRWFRRPGAFLALAWIGLFLSAGILTTEAPNTYRIYGIVPGILLAVGLAVDVLARRLSGWLGADPIRVLGPAVLLAVSLLDLPAYFTRFAKAEGTWAGFHAGDTRVALAVSQLNGKWDVVSDFLSNSAARVLVARPERELRVTDDLLAAPGPPVSTLWMMSAYDTPLAGFLKSIYPEARVSSERTPSGQTLYTSVAVAADQMRTGFLVERGAGGIPPGVEALAAEKPGAAPGKVRWSGALRVPATGRYRFDVSSSNVTSLFFNGEETLSVPAGGKLSRDVWLPKGIVPVRIERDVRRPDSLEVLWAPPGENAPRALPREAAAPVRIPEGGLLALVWEGARLTGPPVSVRHDPLLLAVKYGNASVCAERWVGDLIAPATGNYDFVLISDDGSRMFLDGKLVLARWELDAVTARATVPLTEGRHAIVLEFVDYGGSRSFEARWTPPGKDSERLPAEALRWRPEHVREALAVRPDPPVSIEARDASGRSLGSVALSAARPEKGEAPRQDANTLGWILKVGRNMYDHGIGVRGTASLDFALKGAWSRLTGKIAVDQDTYGNGRVRFRVLGDGKPLFESEAPPLERPPGSFDVSVAGVRLLTLAVEDSDGSKPNFGDWLDLALVR